MQLVDMYLDAVAAELPADKQQEIRRELKASLQDELAVMAEETGDVSEAQVAALLQRLGHPRTVASSYHPALPLVASEDMPLFKQWVWYSACVVLAFSLLQSLAGLVVHDSLNPVRFLVQLAFEFVDSFSVVLLLLIASFYGLAKLGELKKWRERPWQLSDLPKNSLASIKFSDMVSDLVSASFLLLLLWTPLWMSAAAQQQLLVAFTPAAEPLRYLLTLLCIASIGLTVVRLWQRVWQRWSVWAYALEHTAFALVFAVLAVQWPTYLQWQSHDGHPLRLEWLLQLCSSALTVTAVILFMQGLWQLRRLRVLHA